ncbi:helix-turn-helix domain-containing protein [Fructilactobacillus sp. Tb1]|uniref:helix-turn-helix domain-containing protein n=1 Tax=Fructilactobacillus sp. Tb1 TaxID=3422304 RepID=UPI003D28F9B2
MWEKIQPLLDERMLNPKKLSEIMGLKNSSTIYDLKNGKIKKPSFDLMSKIAVALGVSLDEFR